MKNKRFRLLLIMMAILTLCGCSKKEEKVKLTIAYQYGIAYAPAEIMQYNRMLEEKLPEVEIEWVIQGSGAAINEGIISGDIDIAMMGVAPFLIGWDKGIPYKIYSAISGLSTGLISYDENIKSLADFKQGDKIAVPSIGSAQHIFLAMAAEKELGDMHVLDKYLVSMSHPDAYMALLSKSDVKAHFSSPPYFNKELKEEGMHLITSAEYAIGGEYNHIVGVMSNDFAEKHPEFSKTIKEVTEEAIQYIYDNPDDAATILAEIEKVEREEMVEYLQYDAGKYSTKIVSVMEMADFMMRADYISKVPEMLEDIIIE